MKKILFSIGLLSIAYGSYAQTYEFQTIKDIEANPVISQDQTGTCWSFATTSFLEAEIIRLTGKHIDLSEMYNVRNTYPKKAWNYVMRQGKAQFGEGALAHDVINSARDFGVVPQSVYSGKLNSDEKYNHAEMTAVLEAMLKTYVSNPGKKLSPQWKDAINAVLDVYMGKNVTEFTYEGKKYTPKSFFETTKIKPEDYITISSFSNEALYKPFMLPISDNFSNFLGLKNPKKLFRELEILANDCCVIFRLFLLVALLEAKTVLLCLRVQNLHWDYTTKSPANQK